MGIHPVGAPCPLITTLLADEYAYLLGQYLGDGSLARHRRGVYRLVITCCADYPEIIKRVEASMLAVRPNAVGRVARPGCVNLSSYSRHWPCLFPQHGPGKKHDRPIALERWQRRYVDEAPRSFLAGLFHADGSRCINRITHRRGGGIRIYEYPRYFFSNESLDILNICGDALELVGVDWRFNNRNSISVARRAAVAALDEFIGAKT